MPTVRPPASSTVAPREGRRSVSETTPTHCSSTVRTGSGFQTTEPVAVMTAALLLFGCHAAGAPAATQSCRWGEESPTRAKPRGGRVGAAAPRARRAARPTPGPHRRRPAAVKPAGTPARSP
ncbi:hypothetical protein GCM10010340_09340 [Streptomyces griseoloalbus]|nr:hypothetical protein GCM10010340_09340 [Streptomyces albaduncus]